MLNRDFWKNPEAITTAITAYHKKDYATALHCVINSDPNEEIDLAATGDIADNKIDALSYELKQNYARHPATQTIEMLKTGSELACAPNIKWFAQDFSFITEKETRQAYLLAQEAFAGYCAEKNLALITQTQTTYHATEKEAFEQLAREYQIELNPQERGR